LEISHFERSIVNIVKLYQFLGNTTEIFWSWIKINITENIEYII